MASENLTLDLSGQWVGNSWGTHPATLYVELTERDNALQISLRANQQNEILCFEGASQRSMPLRFDVTETTAGSSTPSSGVIVLEHVTPERMEGSWESSTGGKGIISLARRLSSGESGPEPEQIISFEFDLGPVRIGREDVERITKTLDQILPNSRGVVISFKEKSKSTIKFARDFIASIDRYGRGESLNISVQSAVENTTNVTIKFEKFENKIVVQSSSEWQAKSIFSVLKEEISGKSKWLIELYKKFGLIPNTFVFFILLILLPELTLFGRVILVVVGFAILVAHFYLYQYTSRTIIDFRKVKFKWWQQSWPFVSSVVSAIISGLIVLFAYDLLTKS